MTASTHIIADEAAMENYGRALAGELKTGDIICIEGSLGAGKTVLCRGILYGLGYSGEVASPSYAIVHEYHPPEVKLPILHADLYRIEGPEEITEIGLLEDNSDRIILVEWAQRYSALKKFSSHNIDIQITDEGRRLTVG